MNPPDDRCALFARRVQEAPDNPMFRFSLGQALAAAGRHAESVEHLKLAADSRADWMVPRILLGKALQATGDIDGARAVFEDSLKLARSQGHEEPEEELLVLIRALS